MHLKDKQQLKLMNTMMEAVEYIKNNAEPEGHVFNSFKEGLFLLGIHAESYIIELLDLLKTDRSKLEEFLLLFEKWFDTNIITLSNRVKTSESYKNGILGCDRKFKNLISIIKNNSEQALIDNAMSCLKEIKEKNSELYELLTVGYRGWYFESNWLDGVDGGNNSLVTNRIVTLKSNIEKLAWLYDHLEDNLSKSSLNALIISWLTFSMHDALKISTYSTQNGVADPDIFPFYDNEVYVDCGSFIGDTVLEFVNEFSDSYSKIYTYDISAATVDQMKQNLKNLDNIVFNVKGVSDKPGELNLAGVDAPFPGNRLVEGDGVAKVPIVKLDDDIQEPITFLKIDVEGLDKEAIQGAKNHIIKHHPKMHIDTYHKLVDVFEVPILIHSIDPSYKFYLRISNSLEKRLMFATTCIYAI